MTPALRQERVKRGWTLTFVADACGVSAQAVCDWEHNRRRPSYEVLVRLEDLFQLNHRTLFAESTYLRVGSSERPTR